MLALGPMKRNSSQTCFEQSLTKETLKSHFRVEGSLMLPWKFFSPFQSLDLTKAWKGSQVEPFHSWDGRGPLNFFSTLRTGEKKGGHGFAGTAEFKQQGF